MNEVELLEALREHGALRTGHFRLSSGLHSDVYVQCAQLLQWPGMAERSGHELSEKLANLQPSVVLAPALGGLIIGHEVARHLGVRMVFCERVDGRMTLRRGFEMRPEDRVVVIEDVVSTGGSQREALACARQAGGEPVGVGSIIDRSGGASFGLRFVSLATIEASAWDPSDCPLCRSGDAVDTPGSRVLRS